MIVVLFIIIIVAFFTLIERGKDEEHSFWKGFFQKITLKVIDYYCKGTPTKVVILTIRGILLMYECVAIGYPLVRAGLKFDGSKNYWSSWLECQWDSVSSTTTYVFLGSIVALCVIYLLTYKNEEKIEELTYWIKEAFHNVFRKLGSLQTSVTTIGSDITDIKTQMKNMSSVGLSTLEHLIPEIHGSILQLKVKTATKYLETIQKELEVASIQNNKLTSYINYNLGLCARFTKDKKSGPYFRKAYQQMKSVGIQNPNIIEEMVRVLCLNDKDNEINMYIDELRALNAYDVWCFVPSLLKAQNLREAYAALPNSVDKKNVLAYTIMLGGGKENDLGIALEEYVYSDLDCIRVDNLQLWVMDFSVASTQFCQHLVIRKQVKDMMNIYTQKLFELTDRFLESLKDTEMENLLPDTIFLHAFCGYLKNQSPQWLNIIRNATYSESMKEIYYICISFMLNDSGKHEESLALLKGYGDDTIASILNLRIQTAIQANDFKECIEAFLFACERNIVIPDHLAYCIFGVIGFGDETIGNKAEEVAFENPLTKMAYHEYLNFIRGKSVNVEFVKEKSNEFSDYVIPYVAMIAKEKISLEFAVELLEKVVDRKVLDIRSNLLIDYYLKDKKYTKELYGLLADLRHSGEADLRCMFIELRISSSIHDDNNSLAITQSMLKIQPNDMNVMISHVQTLFASGNHAEEIIEYKSRFIEKTLHPNAVVVLFNIYIGIDEYQYALELLYKNIVTTQNQELKDYYLQIHLNPNLDTFISKEKDSVESGDFVTLQKDNDIKRLIVSDGSQYECLIGCRKGEKKVIKTHEDIEVEVVEIHTKYYKLLVDIYGEIHDYGSSKNIRMFSTKDFDFESDPLGALMKMAGNTEENRKKEKAILQQYQNGTMPLSCFINDNSIIAGLYDKILGNFMVCTLPYQTFSMFFDKNRPVNKFDVVLDLSALLTLQELDARFHLSLNKKLYISKGIINLIKQQIFNEEKGFPAFINSFVSPKLTVDVRDSKKSLLWNKLKTIEDWIADNCIVEVVKEIANYEQDEKNSLVFNLETESLLQAKGNRILLTEDWFYTKHFAGVVHSINTYNWLVLIGCEKTEECGLFLLNSGNVGYPMKKDYLCKHFHLFSSSKPNNYQICLSNMKYYPLCWDEVLKAAKQLLMGIIDPAKQMNVTNMITILFKNINDNGCRMIINREMLLYKDSLYHQCLFDALRISHPLLLPQ